MRISCRKTVIFRSLTILLPLLIALLGTQSILAQAPKMDRGPMPKMPLQIKPDPRVQQRKYHLAAANEDLISMFFMCPPKSQRTRKIL